MEYPKTLYVAIKEQGTENECLHADEVAEEIVEVGEPQEIAIYKLISTKKVSYVLTDIQ